MAQITYADKVAINVDPNVPDVNKCKADDMNEIKNVINTNDGKTLYTDNTTAYTPTNDYNPATKKYVDESNAGVTFGWSNDISLAQTNKLIAIDLVKAGNINNNEFTIGTGTNAGKIIIGAGVNTVLISSSIYCSVGFTANDSVYFEVDQVRTSPALTNVVQAGRKRLTSTNPYEMLNSGVAVISVQQGDIIEIYIRNTSGARGTVTADSPGSYLTLVKLA